MRYEFHRYFSFGVPTYRTLVLLASAGKIDLISFAEFSEKEITIFKPFVNNFENNLSYLKLEILDLRDCIVKFE